ncbi:hypothetical protein BMS3Abin14_01636 [bacterium BMS3Abin14]|nr:hypothetical protein BMS3Abin14_01636 [bacterium BMS3Abin14]
MKLMLDTNICIYIIKQQPESVLERFLDYQVGDIRTSLEKAGTPLRSSDFRRRVLWTLDYALWTLPSGLWHLGPAERSVHQRPVMDFSRPYHR